MSTFIYYIYRIPKTNLYISRVGIIYIYIYISKGGVYILIYKIQLYTIINILDKKVNKKDNSIEQ